MTFKNMKILVENNLDEIVAELEKRGYICNFETARVVRIVYVFDTGFYGLYSNNTKTCTNKSKLTSLAELKEM